MVREIICAPCFQNGIPKQPVLGRRFVEGEMRAESDCDRCGKKLQKSERAAAISYFKNTIYYPWEHMHLIIRETQLEQAESYRRRY